MEPITHKEYWIRNVKSQIYMLGINFPREHYYANILPKHTTKRLKQFYLDYQAITMKQEFQLHNTYWKDENLGTYGRCWGEIRKINTRCNRLKTKLARKLNQELK